MAGLAGQRERRTRLGKIDFCEIGNREFQGAEFQDDAQIHNLAEIVRIDRRYGDSLAAFLDYQSFGEQHLHRIPRRHWREPELRREVALRYPGVRCQRAGKDLIAQRLRNGLRRVESCLAIRRHITLMTDLRYLPRSTTAA